MIASTDIESISANFKKVVETLTENIIKDYDAEREASVKAYLGSWKGRIKSCAKNAGIALLTTEDPWGKLFERLGKTRDTALSSTSPTETTTSSKRPRRTSSPSREPSEVSSVDSSQETTSHTRLSVLHLNKVNATYKSIPQDKKWRLATRKIVEDEMEKVAATLMYEHPVHSLILDPEDPIWGDVFTEEELTEIRGYNIVTLPELPETLQGCLDGFYGENWKTGVEIFNYARNMKRHPIQEPDLYWLERSTQAISHLFLKSDTLSFEGHSEAEALHLFWPFCYTLYDNGAVQAKIGERASTAVAIGRSIFREVFTGTKRRRNAVGAKLDILYRSAATEFGCCEVGRLDVTPVDTKYIDDSFFKMPKTLRDMLVTLYRQKPGTLQKLTTVGYLLMGK